MDRKKDGGGADRAKTTLSAAHSAPLRSPSLTSGRFAIIKRTPTAMPVVITDLRFTVYPSDYQLQAIIGNDGRDRPTVFQALHVPTGAMVAIKRIDVEKYPELLEPHTADIVHACSLRHKNIRTPLVSFLAGTELWSVMRIMDAGSAWRAMQYGSRPGLDESAIAYVLGEILKALLHLHQHGYVHNGVKASSVLVDTDGTVQLGDFRDMRTMIRQGQRVHAIHDYTGTAATIPWLAPEVLDQDLYGYDQKADVYSVGITALELANCHAPYSKMPPTKAFLLKMNGTITLEDYLGPQPRRMSKAFRSIVNLCLNRDPRLRPTASKLLEHPFFKHHKRKVGSLLDVLKTLPPLSEHLPSRSH
eukprot:comp20234_c1_seq1/m.25229 comp20234_c1_seq1/g.25229  ORF comp20234_c1_seq1/g.25229 comp20234_c1_seq1/m.25229 type:complete len:360 (-) comp20234_c1_seq1:360-1439(-)